MAWKALFIMAIHNMLNNVSASTQPCLTLLLTENAIEQRSPNFLASGISFVENNFFMDHGGGSTQPRFLACTVYSRFALLWVSSAWFSEVELRWLYEPWGVAANTNEVSLTCPLLTSTCAAWFLIGHRPVPVCGLGVEDSCLRGFSTASTLTIIKLAYHLNEFGGQLNFDTISPGLVGWQYQWLQWGQQILYSVHNFAPDTSPEFGP